MFTSVTGIEIGEHAVGTMRRVIERLAYKFVGTRPRLSLITVIDYEQIRPHIFRPGWAILYRHAR